MTRADGEEARRKRAELVEKARRVDLIAYAGKLVAGWDKKKSNGDNYWARCPMHEENSASFHAHKDGWFKCFGCGAKGGDAIALCMQVEHTDFVQAVEKLAGEKLPEQMRYVEPSDRKLKDFDPDKRAAAKAIWDAAQPIAGTLAETYLRARGVSGDLSETRLRFHPAAPVKGYSPRGSEYAPAMVAAIRKPSGEFIGAHVTYLAANGLSKANIEPARKVYGNQDGGLIFLALIADRMVIGEGIESALTASEITGRAAVAAVCSGNMAKLPPIEGVSDWLVAYDRDANQTGFKAGKAFADRARAAGLSVRALPPPADVKDWNDAAQRRA